MVIYLGVAVAICQLTGHVSGSTSRHVTRQGTNFFVDTHCSTTLVGTGLFARSSAASFFFFGILRRTLSTIFGGGSFTVRGVIRAMGVNGTITSTSGNTSFLTTICTLLGVTGVLLGGLSGQFKVYTTKTYKLRGLDLGNLWFVLGTRVVFLVTSVSGRTTSGLFVLGSFGVYLFHTNFLTGRFFCTHGLLVVENVGTRGLYQNGVVFFVCFEGMSFSSFFGVVSFTLLYGLRGGVLGEKRGGVLHRLYFVLNKRVQVVGGNSWFATYLCRFGHVLGTKRASVNEGRQVGVVFGVLGRCFSSLLSFGGLL